MVLKKLLEKVRRRKAKGKEQVLKNSTLTTGDSTDTSLSGQSKEQLQVTPSREDTSVEKKTQEIKQESKVDLNDKKEESEDELSEEEEEEYVEVEEEEDEGDAFVGEFEMDHKSKNEDYRALSPEQIVSEQQKEIAAISDLFQISKPTAAALLRHFQWKKERLIQRYLENPEQVRKDAGVALSGSIETPVRETKVEDHGSNELCTICGDDLIPETSTSLNCKHIFCNECWKNYLGLKIKEGDVSKIKCPHNKCDLAVDEMTVKKLVPCDVYDRFVRFITRSFVEDSDGRVKWCPQPNCGNAITTDMVKGTIVKCTCGYRFCFSCHREAHAPATCEQVKQWEQKCADDSETTHWKYANTKDCPKCDLSVEKNGGCNHMTCFKCKHEWCWVCMKPWKGHNDYYNCNKFTKPERKPIFFKKGKKKDKIKEREEERERNRIALEIYLHYYERFVNHSHSRDLEKQMRDKALAKMNELQKEAITSSEVQYVLEGTETLLECRNVLKFTYVTAYYLPEDGQKKKLFELLQQNLEKTTELLSELLESSLPKQVDRLKALNLIQLAQTQKDNLIIAVEQGLNEFEQIPTQ